MLAKACMLRVCETGTIPNSVSNNELHAFFVDDSPNPNYGRKDTTENTGSDLLYRFDLLLEWSLST